MRAPAAGSGPAWVRGLALSGLSGLILGLTFTPFGGPLLPFLAFAPLAFHLSGPPVPGPGLKAGFVTAAVSHGIGLQWMIPALSWRTSLAVPTYVAVLAVIGLGGALAVESVHRLRRRVRLPLPVALAVAWMAFEWAAARLPGLPYAWLNAGASLAWYPELSWVAGVGGGGALTFWTVLAGGWIGMAMSRFARREGSARSPLVEGVGFALVLGIPMLGGVWEGEAPEPAGGQILAVQPGREEAAQGPISWEGALRRELERGDADLVIFPERFLNGVPRPGGDGDALAGRLGVPVLFGAIDRDVAASGDTAWYNAAFLALPAAGDTGTQVVRKRHLVPGLEDGGSPGGGLFGLPSRGYRAGPGATLIRAGGRTLAVLICYDSAFRSYARGLAARGADLLVVISNDDWLDPAGPERSTVAYWQHETQGRLRARENGLPLVQVASTGRTFSVDARGRSVPLPGSGTDTVPLFTRDVVRLEVGGAAPPTLFRRSGDVLGAVAFGLWLLGAWPGRWRQASGVPIRS